MHKTQGQCVFRVSCALKGAAVEGVCPYRETSRRTAVIDLPMKENAAAVAASSSRAGVLQSNRFLVNKAAAADFVCLCWIKERWRAD